MFATGQIIGQIVDNLALLENQLQMRASVGLFDLNKYIESFFKEILNIIYDLKLENLNSERTNNPGLDLGDTGKGIAFQVTSEKTSAKINQTLGAITEEQKAQYPQILIFIAGKKQMKYQGVDEVLAKQFNFSEKNILDIRALLKALFDLDTQSLFKLHDVFNKQFLYVKAELEMPDENRSYPTSLLNKIERPSGKLPKEFASFFTYYKKEITTKKERRQHAEAIVALFNKLQRMPRISREFLLIVFELGDFDNDVVRVFIPRLREKLRYDENQLDEAIQMLEEEFLAEVIVEENEEYVRKPKAYLQLETKISYLISEIATFARSKNKKLEQVIVSLDFSCLDSE
jgi:hypothetical protein